MAPNIFITVSVALLVFAAFVVIQGSDDCKVKMETYTAACKVTLNASDAEVAAMSKQPPYSRKTKCLIKCVAEKFEVFKNGRLIEPKVLAMIRNDSAPNSTRRLSVNRIFNRCRNLYTRNACDTAANMYACAMDGATKFGLTNKDDKEASGSSGSSDSTTENMP